MDHQLISYAVLIPAAILFFSLGRASKEYPEEGVMYQRIIRARAARHVAKWTAAEVEKDLEEKSLELARKI